MPVALQLPLPTGAPSGRTAVILGAGWSHAAGLPLVNGLFDIPDPFMAAGDRRAVELVVGAYREWQSAHPGVGAEHFMQDAFRGEILVPSRYTRQHRLTTNYALETTLWDGPRQALPWQWVVGAVQVRLAQRDRTAHAVPFDRTTSSRYTPQMLKLSRCPAHRTLWAALRARLDINAVITTNYDVLAERVMRERQSRGAAQVAFHYAGFAGRVRRVNSPYRRDRERPTTPDGPIALAKLHGSLNWSIEDGELVIYPDVRPVWRGGGDAAILPPLPEKDTPSWLEPTWSAALSALAEADHWVVVGYSLPPYDNAIRTLLSDAARCGLIHRIDVIDPYAGELTCRWEDVAPAADVVAHDSPIEGFNPDRLPYTPQRGALSLPFAEPRVRASRDHRAPSGRRLG